MIDGIQKNTVDAKKYKSEGVGQLGKMSMDSPTYPTQVEEVKKDVNVVREEAKESEE